QDAVAERVEIAADNRDLDPLVQRAGKERDSPTAGDSHRGEATRIDLGPRREVIYRPHHIPHPPGDHRLTEQQSGAPGRLARRSRSALPARSLVAPATKSKLLDGERSIAVFNDFNGKIIFVAALTFALLAFLCDADHIVNSPTMTRQTDDGRHRTGTILGK